MCKNHTEGKPTTFEDPDKYILVFAGKLLVRYKELDLFAEEMERIQELHINDINMKELAECLCKLYQNLTEKLYDTNCRVKECANFVARDRDFADYERVLIDISEQHSHLLFGPRVHRQEEDGPRALSLLSGSSASPSLWVLCRYLVCSFILCFQPCRKMMTSLGGRALRKVPRTSGK